MSRILITGASSYLGAVLARQLIDRGDEVHVTVRSGTGPDRLDARIPDAHRHLVDGTTEQVFAAVDAARPDCVYHLVSLYLRSADVTQVRPMLDANIDFGVQLCEALAKRGAPVRFVTFGTYSQFYRTDPPRPLDLYSALKTAFAEVLAYYADAHAFEVVSLTIYDSYGPGDWRTKIVKVLADAARSGNAVPLSDPEIEIDLTHIDDVARAALTAADVAISPGDVAAYAVSGERMTLRELVRMVEQVSGRSLDAKWGSYPLPERRIMQPVKGTPLPGWRPRIALADGLAAYFGSTSET